MAKENITLKESVTIISSEDESINDLGHDCHKCNKKFPFESYLKKHFIAVHQELIKENTEIEYSDFNDKKTNKCLSISFENLAILGYPHCWLGVLLRLHRSHMMVLKYF